MTVIVKIGGSLYDLPDLRERLLRFLAGVASPCLLVPGGGPTADVIRALDRDHELGPVRSHWLALRACTLNAHFLRELLLPEMFQWISDPGNLFGVDRGILDPFAFASLDEGRDGCLPHHWDATSDSVAARVAVVAGASRLVLLKSITLPAAMTWEQAAEAGHVDPVFAGIIGQARGRFIVEAVNLRA